MLTGMGINPRYVVNQNVPVVSERYRMLFHHLSSFIKSMATVFHFILIRILDCFRVQVRFSLM